MTTTPPRILAIDDTPANLLTLGAALAGEFELQIATSGPQGLAIAEETPPDLILLDIMMPDMDGYEVCRRLKAIPALSHIPVVFVTAMNDVQSEAHGLQLGAADYLIKPINVGIARQRIRNLLEREQFRKEVEIQRDQLAAQIETLLNLTQAVEQSPASVVITNLDAGIQYVNPRFTEVTGYLREEVLGQNPRILQSGQTEKDTYERFWQKLTSGEPWKGELCNKRKNGELYWEEAQIAPVKNHEGKITHYVGVKTDITQRKQLEASRDEALNRLQKIAQRVPGVVYQYRVRPDGTSCFPFASEAMHQIYRMSPEEIREDASAVFSILHPDDLEAVRTSILHSMETLSPWRHEYRVRYSDGTVRWLFGDAVPEREQDGGTLWHGFITDITERKHNEEELLDHRNHLEALVQARTAELSIAKELAESANRAKTTFLANMSHELRTPLNAIMGLTSLAQRRITDPRLADQLNKVERASQHLLGIINDVLDISKIEAERMTLEQVDFQMAPILDNVRNLLGHKAQEKEIALRFDATPELLQRPLLGDPLRLGQILLNLAGNAIKFTANGSVTVSIREAREDGASLTLEFRITDTGIGIPAEDQQRIFTSFEQADGSMTRKYGGTGLGLSICRHLVRLMEGEIGVSSDGNQGSTFWFTARLKKAAAHTSAQLPEAIPSELRIRENFSGRRILLAEDEPINQEVARELLQEVGLHVDVANNGIEATSLACLNDYALILMDMQMPEMNGVEATRTIRRLPNRQNTPILAMTANAYPEDQQRCLEAGMNDFITKPVAPETLFDTLLRWLK